MREDTAREWGLFLSHSILEAERVRFPEPGVFLIKPDRSLCAAWIQSVPFARPVVEDLLGAFEFVQENDYPPHSGLAA